MTAAITVFREPNGKRLNKEVCLDPEGKPVKKPGLIVEALAEKREVSDLAALAEVLREIGERSDMALSMSVYPDQEPGQIVHVLTKGALKQKAEEAGIAPRAVPKGFYPYPGLHEIEGELYGARLKESMVQGGVLLFDRDTPDGMPPELADLSFEDWRSAMALLFPGFDRCGMVWVPSTSNRVMLDGEPISRGLSGHGLVIVKDAELAKQAFKFASHTALVTSYDLEPWGDDPHPVPLCFGRPTRCRKTGRQIGTGWRTIFDYSTYAESRPVFSGAPEVAGDRLSILPPPPVDVLDGPPLDLALVQPPQDMDAVARAIYAITRSRVQFVVERDRPGTGRKSRVIGFSASYADLTLDTALELGDGSWTTVRELFDSGAVKVRIQSPYRPESRSEAAFFARDRMTGEPFVYDSGTLSRHNLDRSILKTTADVIKEWIINEHRPVFRDRAGKLWSGRDDAFITERLLSMPQSLVDALHMTSDRPDPDKKGGVTRKQILTSFNDWKPTAYAEVLKALPFEEDQATVNSQSGEEFTALMADLLKSLQWVTRASNGASERMPLCEATVEKAFSLPGIWTKLPRYDIYGRALPGPQIEIAITYPLISQAGMSRIMGVKTPTQLSRLCRRYGLMVADDNRICYNGEQIRAIQLSSEFIASLNLDLESLKSLAQRLHDGVAMH